MDYVNMLSDLVFNDKRVLIRTDYNVPMDGEGNITDIKRIEDSLPTLRYLLDNGARQIVILTHIGRPKGHDQKLSTLSVAQKLSDLMGLPVKKVDGWGEQGLPEEKIVMLENVRFSPSEKSKDEQERDSFAKAICKNADVFVMEAFSNMHRGGQASMTSVLKFLPSCLGLAAQKELQTIAKALEDPERPYVAIIGGLKADKLSALKNIIQKADKVLVGGALAFGILSVFGYNMGSSKIDFDGLKEYEDFIKTLRDDPKVILPVDCVLADRFADDANLKRAPISCVKDGWMALDIGRKTLESYKLALMTASTITWNGPIGVFEFPNFSEGTKDIARAVADSGAMSIIGGGDSAAAIEQLGFKDKVSFVSSGGGASLMMFEGKELPVLKSMKDNYSRFQ